MHISDSLAVYWRTPVEIQIGLDPRRGIILDGLTPAEAMFVDHLTSSHSEVEVALLAKRFDIDTARYHDILSLLERAGVCAPPEPPIRDIAVEFARMDALAVSIALILTRSGISTIVCRDQSPVSARDHPALAQRLGMPRDVAIRGLLREINPMVSTSGQPQLAVLTGSHVVDPVIAHDYSARGTAVLTAWAEEFDVMVGPLKAGLVGSCSTCLFNHRLDANPLWNRLAPQALGGRDVDIESTTRELAASLAARAVIAFAAGENSLESTLIRIPPLPGSIDYLDLPPHPACACVRLAPELDQDIPLAHG